MLYTENIEQAREYSNKALALMHEQEIPATPINFEVWYAYVSGANHKLVQTIDILRSNGRTFDQDTSENLFEEHLAENDREAIEAFGAKIDQQVNHILKHVDGMSGETGQFGDSLDAMSSSLKGEPDSDTLQKLISNLHAATQQMRERSEDIDTQLKLSKSEVKQLRSDLASVREEAMQDKLTGIANRRAFDDALRAAAIVAMEDGSSLSLLMADVDHFKKFNDEWGHQIGDQVLQLVSGAIQSNTRSEDTPARYGGEEFAVILVDASLEAATGAAENIRAAVEAKQLVRRSTGQTLGSVTLSLGVAIYEPGEPLGDLVRRADACLYAAKSAGRNQVKSQPDQGIELVSA